MVDRENINKLLDFMMGLNSSYKTVRDHILALDPLPNVNQTFFKIQQAEMQQNIQDRTIFRTDNVALAAHLRFQTTHAGASHLSDGQGYRPQSVVNKKGKASWECTFYGKRGHTRNFCFKLKEAEGAKQSGRIAAHVEEVSYYQNDPLEEVQDNAVVDKQPITDIDPVMIDAVYHKVMQAFQDGRGQEYIIKYCQNVGSAVYGSHVGSYGQPTGSGGAAAHFSNTQHHGMNLAGPYQ